VAAVALAVVFSWQLAAAGQAAENAPSAAATAAGDVWAASFSTYGQPATVGKTVGEKLQELCKGRKPSLVLVFQFLWTFPSDQERQLALDAMAESFDKKTIYGISVGPLCDLAGAESQNMGAMALGGDIQPTAVNVKVEKGKENEAYKTLAEGLQGPYTQAAGKGRLILILGACDKTTSSRAIVDTFQNVLGKDVQLFGPGTPGTSHFFQGEVQENALTAVLLTGNFTCDFATALAPMEEGGHLDTDKILASAKEAMAVALGDKKDDVAAILAASYTTRGHSIKDRTKKEEIPVTQAARETTGALMFVWDYGSEIAHPKTGDPAVATKGHIAVCVIRKAAPQSGK